MIHRILALGVGAAVSLVTIERDAHACSPPSCSQDLVTIAGDVPASAIAFPFVEGTLADGRPKPGSTFRLEDPTGSEVPWITKADPWWPSGSILTPIALTSRTGYALLHNEACSQGGGPTGPNVKRLFDVVPAVELPSSVLRARKGGRQRHRREDPSRRVRTALAKRRQRSDARHAHDQRSRPRRRGHHGSARDERSD